MFGDVDQPRGWFPAPAPMSEMLANGVARQRLDIGIAGVIAEGLDLLLVKPFGDQLAFGPGDDLVKAVIAVADVARAALDAEFLRGTPSTLAWASFRVVTMVTSWVTGAAGGGGETAEASRGEAMFMGSSSPILVCTAAAGISASRRISIDGIVAQMIQQKPEQPARLLRRWRRLRGILRTAAIHRGSPVRHAVPEWILGT